MNLGDSGLQPGERLLWSGSPKRRRFFDIGELMLLPVFAAWVAFAVFGVQQNGQSPLFFPPFVLVVCYIAFGQPLLRYLRLGRTTYLLTDRRVIVRTSFLGGKERSEYLTALSPPVIRAAAGSTGTVTFGQLSLPVLIAAMNALPVNRSRRAPAILLVGIEDPVRVRDLIATSTEAARRHSTT